MAYLRYYRYRGDPGLFSGVGKLLGKALPIVGGFIPGVGGILSKVGGIIGAGARAAGKVEGAVAGRVAGPIVSLPGVIGAIGKAVGTGAAIGAGGLMVDKLLGGRGGGGGRRYKRMNVGNVKALRRSMRRVEGFAKLAKSTISFTTHTRMKKRARKR